MTDLGMPLEELGLTARPYHCLQRAGIRTLGELVQLSEFDLWELRNFGAKSVHEVKLLLSQIGLALSDTLPSFSPKEAPARLSLTGTQLIDALAKAWDEGAKAAIEREHTYGAEEKAKFNNPYRSDK